MCFRRSRFNGSKNDYVIVPVVQLGEGSTLWWYVVRYFENDINGGIPLRILILNDLGGDSLGGLKLAWSFALISETNRVRLDPQKVRFISGISRWYIMIQNTNPVAPWINLLIRLQLAG